MSMYLKKYVRVESLALTRAIELQKEAGFGDLYLSSSVMLAERGWAQDMHSNRGYEKGLSLSELGLEGEVDEINVTDGYGYGNSPIFLERHYLFLFNNGTNTPALQISVVIAKVGQKRDWDILVESICRGRNGSFFPSEDGVLHRDYRESAA